MDAARAHLTHTACVDFHSTATLAPNQRAVDYKVPPDLSSQRTQASVLGLINALSGLIVALATVNETVSCPPRFCKPAVFRPGRAPTGLPVRLVLHCHSVQRQLPAL